MARDHPDSPWGRLAELAAADIGRRARRGTSEAIDRIVTEAETLAAEGEPGAALEDLRREADARRGTLAEQTLRRAAIRIGGEYETRVRRAEARARAALAAHDNRTALAAVTRALEFVTPDRKNELLALKRRIEDAMSGVVAADAHRGDSGGSSSGGGETAAGGRDGSGGEGTAPVEPEPPPDTAAREDEAAKLFRTCKRQMDSGRHVEALSGLLRFLREFGDTEAGSKHDTEARRRITSLATGEAGIELLFRGEVSRADKGRYRVKYDFEDEEQMLDFRDVNAFAAPPRAEWSHVSGAPRAKGSGALVLDAKFRSDFLSVRVKIEPERAHDVGVMFLETGRSDRYYLFTIQNSWFTLGLGDDAEIFRENAIVLFGPDMWKDTPPGEAGFVRKAGTDEPTYRSGELIEVKAGKSDDQVWMRFPGGRTIRGSAYGDVRYEFDGLSPGVFVLNSSAAFDELIVEGIPDADWVAERWRAILSGL